MITQAVEPATGNWGLVQTPLSGPTLPGYNLGTYCQSYTWERFACPLTNFPT